MHLLPFHPPRTVQRRDRLIGGDGYSLLELLVALTVLAIAASLAAPRLGGFLLQNRMRAAMNQLTADVYQARMLAVHSGRRVEIRFVRPDDGPCVAEYTVVVMSSPPSEVRRVSLVESTAQVCLRKNGPNPMSFNSRGRPNWNYSFWTREGELVDSLTMTQLGRIYRW